MRRPPFMALMLLLFAATAHGASRDKSAKPQALDLDKPLPEQVELIQKQLDDGETYAEIAAADRAKVKESLARFASIINESGGSLNPEQKTQLANERNEINQILSQAAADSRLICRREAQIGSLRTTTQCKTVAERRRDAQEAQDMMRRNPSGTYNKGS
ncbi:hypothetical protein FB548_0867 [Pseudoxanthomonas sp. 3HH-4]|uniref:hypothetical protein n=1 Tax=Pseudoxanthomonas sp. 3HH-4 TaxID=1690214 RepID=UPI00116B70C3|nr:hypothetical protein [Pseudoxanthomonas sp. 3HH-4]TQM17482.1 hypothetical protein FB548_0867 [Pseudoxanthomonas sp. 3HH-4]